jgi:glycosyltransferase involved in cell wall biosynthesis
MHIHKNKKMRILYVCKSLPHSYQGGIQTHTSKLAMHLAERGQEIDILTAGSLRNGEKRYMLNGCTVIEVPYVPMRRLPFLPTFLEELSFNISAWLWMKRHQSDYDIVHLQGRSGFLFPKQQNKTPIFTTFHGLITLENRFSKQVLNLDKKIHQRFASYFEKNALKNSDAVIAVSHEMQSELHQMGVQKKTQTQYILPNGVSENAQNGQYTEGGNNPNLLIFVGRLDRIKGIFNLIKAMKLVDKNVQLVMIGDGNDRLELEKLIHTEGVAERVKLVGSQSNDLVLQWIKRGFALVLSSFHETQGIVLLEANACGKPVAAANVGGVPEVVSHEVNGLLFDPHDIQSMAAAINRLYQNPELARKLGEKGRQIVAEKFSWTKIAADTEGVYEQVLAQKKNETQKHKAMKVMQI